LIPPGLILFTVEVQTHFHKRRQGKTAMLVPHQGLRRGEKLGKNGSPPIDRIGTLPRAPVDDKRRDRLAFAARAAAAPGYVKDCRK